MILCLGYNYSAYELFILVQIPLLKAICCNCHFNMKNRAWTAAAAFARLLTGIALYLANNDLDWRGE